MPSAMDVLETVQLTTNIANIEPRTTVIKELLMRGKSPQFTEATRIEFGEMEDRQEDAIYLPRDSHAQMIGEPDRNLKSFQTLNMALMFSIRPTDFYETRTAGEGIYIGAGGRRVGGRTHRARLQERVTQQQTKMRDKFAYNHEWFASRLLGPGAVSYSYESGSSFSIDFDKPATHTPVVGEFWNVSGQPLGTDNPNAQPIANIRQMREIGAGFPNYFDMTLALVHPDVATHMLQSEYFRKRLDTRNYDEGRGGTSFLSANFAYETNGSLNYIGTVGGVEFWSYNLSRTVAGTTVSMIRPGHIELFRIGADNGIEEWYSAHHDMSVRDGAPILTEVFSKSWDEDYPSRRLVVNATRPTMFPKAKGFSVSMQVLTT